MKSFLYLFALFFCCGALFSPSNFASAEGEMTIQEVRDQIAAQTSFFIGSPLQEQNFFGEFTESCPKGDECPGYCNCKFFDFSTGGIVSALPKAEKRLFNKKGERPQAILWRFVNPNLNTHRIFLLATFDIYSGICDIELTNFIGDDEKPLIPAITSVIALTPDSATVGQQKISCKYVDEPTVTPLEKAVGGPSLDANSLRNIALSKLNPMKYTSVTGFIGLLINFLTMIIGSMALVLYIYAGVLWMTAAGSAERITSAKNVLIWTSLGVVVTVSSYIIVQFIFGALNL